MSDKDITARLIDEASPHELFGAGEWLIGRELRQQIEMAADNTGKRLYDRESGKLLGWPVSWTDGDEIRMMIDPRRYVRTSGNRR